MQAIASLVQDDPYLKMPRAERIAARRARREKFRGVVAIMAAPLPEAFVESPPPILNPMPKFWFSMVGDGIRPAIDHIQRVVCRHYGVSRADMLSQRRTKTIVLPRQVAVYICKRVTVRSLPEIGRRFGGRDHTTQIYSIAKIARLMTEDAGFAAEVEGIIASLEVPE